MTYVTLIFISLFAFTSFSAEISKPVQGNYDWTQFYGNYKYVSCQIKDNQPIWADDPRQTTIEISNNTTNPYTIEMIRWPKNSSYILLALSFDYINQGKKIKYDPDTNKISDSTESYSTVNGVYNFLEWNFKDINVGWSSTELVQLSNQRVRYTMRIQRQEDANPREEICVIKRLN